MTDKSIYNINTRELFKEIYCISVSNSISGISVNTYLIIGKEKALLVDTAWGTVDLKKIVSSITELPVTVINTHGHSDHVGGNFQFDSVYIKDDDIPLLQSSFQRNKRMELISNYGSDFLWSGMTQEYWMNARCDNIKSLTGVLSIDIGDRKIDILETPGHTAGSISLIDTSRRVLISGDTLIEGFNLLIFESSSKLDAFMNTLDRIISNVGKFDFVLPSHYTAPLGTDITFSMKKAVEEIILGKMQGTNYQFLNINCLIAKYPNFCILYCEDSL